MSRSRNWVFTLNANEALIEDFAWLQDKIPCPIGSWMDSGKIDYMVCQVEQVAHLHIQGYCQFNTPMSLTACKKINAEAHWEPRRGTHAQAKEYCIKEESRKNGPWELGHERNEAGKRNDLKAIWDQVQAKKTNLEIIEEVGPQAAKFSKQIDWLRFQKQEKESDRQLQGVRVVVVYGPTGLGKTYAAVNIMSKQDDYYIAECPSHKDSKLWFDGYSGQSTLILDDFAGDYCQFRYLLRLLDRYKLKVEIKGGHQWACWTTVIITSNIHPSGWYGQGIDTAPLRRRITSIRLMVEQGVYQEVDWAEHTQGDALKFTQPTQPDTESDHEDGYLTGPDTQARRTNEGTTTTTTRNHN